MLFVDEREPIREEDVKEHIVEFFVLFFFFLECESDSLLCSSTSVLYFFLPPVVSWLFYTMKFDMAEDRDKVIGEGLWMIFDHYLTVAKWSLEFVSSTAKIEKTMVWVRFPGMSLIYYDESVLLVLASAIGTPIKVDQRTQGTRWLMRDYI